MVANPTGSQVAECYPRSKDNFVTSGRTITLVNAVIVDRILAIAAVEKIGVGTAAGLNAVVAGAAGEGVDVGRVAVIRR